MNSDQLASNPWSLRLLGVDAQAVLSLNETQAASYFLVSFNATCSLLDSPGGGWSVPFSWFEVVRKVYSCDYKTLHQLTDSSFLSRRVSNAAWVMGRDPGHCLEGTKLERPYRASSEGGGMASPASYVSGPLAFLGPGSRLRALRTGASVWIPHLLVVQGVDWSGRAKVFEGTASRLHSIIVYHLTSFDFL